MVSIINEHLLPNSYSQPEKDPQIRELDLLPGYRADCRRSQLLNLSHALCCMARSLTDTEDTTTLSMQGRSQ